MKGVFISSLLLLHFYLNASPEKNQSPTIKKQKRLTIAVPELTEANYKKTFTHDLVIIMIRADWCQFCKSTQSLFFENSQELSDQAYFTFINLGNSFEEKSPIMKLFEKKHQITINEVPTLIVIKNGTLIEQVIAQQNKNQIKELVKKYGNIKPA